jgi:Fe-S-cluster containining protein
MSEQNELQTLTANAELVIGGNKLQLKMTVPTNPVPAEAILPTLHSLSNAIVDGVEQKVERSGAKVSCQKGCGACCRQPVPISPPEARLLNAIIENMEEPGRSLFIERFEQAAERLRESGLMDMALNYHRLSEEETGVMVEEYFKLGIACPFLEDESCSIYEFRPLVCREYLVISDARHCATLDIPNLKRLQFPVSVSETFSEMEGIRKEGENPYAPLIMALELSEKNQQESTLLPGPNWIQNFFKDLSGREIPDPEIAK